FVEPLGCCVRATGRTGARAGDTAVVVGLGSIGCLFVQLLARTGATVVGMDASPGRVEIARGLGLPAMSMSEANTAIARLSGGRGADVVLITGGAASALGWAVTAVRDGGSIHYFAGGPGDALPGAPETLYHREVKIEAALTCGTDVKVLRRGHPVMIPHVPTVFGHELAGTVTAVGAGVATVREGDRVVAANSAPCGACPPCLSGRANLCEDLLFVNGAYGQAIALPRRLVSRNVVALPSNAPARRAAFAEPLACALLGIERARVESGQPVAVFGHGPLGCLLAMVAASRKARVIIVGKAGWRFSQVQGLRIGECLDATTTAD